MARGFFFFRKSFSEHVGLQTWNNQDLIDTGRRGPKGLWWKGNHTAFTCTRVDVKPSLHSIEPLETADFIRFTLTEMPPCDGRCEKRSYCQHKPIGDFFRPIPARLDLPCFRSQNLLSWRRKLDLLAIICPVLGTFGTRTVQALSPADQRNQPTPSSGQLNCLSRVICSDV